MCTPVGSTSATRRVAREDFQVFAELRIERGVSSSRHGRRTVNVLPLPSSLSSETSPPSSRHSSRTIDRPRPVPEYSRVIASPSGRTLEPWRNFSNTSCCSSGLMPMPVSVTFSRRSPSSSRSAETRIRPPSGVNLIAFDSRLLRICWTLAWSCRSGGKRGRRVAVELDVLLLGQRPGHVALRGDERADLELAEADFHLAAFDLGQVENVVDHVEQHPAGTLDVADVAQLLVVERLDAAEHVAEAEDAVERRAQLVADGGQEVEDTRERLEPLFGTLPPGEVTVVLHTSAVELDLAQPLLPVVRRLTAPTARRYLAGWTGGNALHVLAPRLLAARAANVGGSREMLLLAPAALYVQLVVAECNRALPPPWSPRSTWQAAHWAWLIAGAGQWFSGQTAHARPAIATA